MRASVVIATKNRKEDLRNAITSALNQDVSVEIIVIDDGSSDGTSDMVKKEFPQVNLERSQKSLGCIVQRNRGAELAHGDVIVSIDDDAILTSPDTVSQTLREFNHPRIGAVAVPYVEPNKSSEIFQLAPDTEAIFVTDTFIGTAHAVRKDIFLRLGGYREVLVHQGEESDYCIRMLDAGYVVRLGTADPLHHMESPLRSYERMDYYGARNNILFSFDNVPHPHFVLHIAGTTFKVITWTFTPSRQILRLKAIIDGFKLGLLSMPRREPVSIQTYCLFRRLRKRKFELLDRIEKVLHPMKFEDEPAPLRLKDY